jgi:DNA-binding GntR family transcriptional regulator
MFDAGVQDEVRAALAGPISLTARKTLGLDEVATLPREAAIEAIEAAHEAFRAAVERSAPTEEIVRLDADFHLAIAEASRNRLLYDLLVDLNAYLSSHRHFALSPSGRAARSLAEHERILEAVLCRDVERARGAMAGHLHSVREYMVGAGRVPERL